MSCIDLTKQYEDAKLCDTYSDISRYIIQKVIDDICKGYNDDSILAEQLNSYKNFQTVEEKSNKRKGIKETYDPTERYETMPYPYEFACSIENWMKKFTKGRNSLICLTDGQNKNGPNSEINFAEMKLDDYLVIGACVLTCIDHTYCYLDYDYNPTDYNTSAIYDQEFDESLYPLYETKRFSCVFKNRRNAPPKEFDVIFPKHITLPLEKRSNLTSLGLFINAFIKGNQYDREVIYCIDGARDSGLYMALEMLYRQTYIGSEEKEFSCYDLIGFTKRKVPKSISNIEQLRFFYLSFLNAFFIARPVKEAIVLNHYLFDKYPNIYKELIQNNNLKSIYQSKYFKDKRRANFFLRYYDSTDNADFGGDLINLDLISTCDTLPSLKHINNAEEADEVQRDLLYMRIHDEEEKRIKFVIDTRSVLLPTIAVPNETIKSAFGYSCIVETIETYDRRKKGSLDITFMSCKCYSPDKNERRFYYIWLKDFSKKYSDVINNNDELGRINFLLNNKLKEADVNLKNPRVSSLVFVQKFVGVQNYNVALIRSGEDDATNTDETLFASLMLIFLNIRDEFKCVNAFSLFDVFHHIFSVFGNRISWNERTNEDIMRAVLFSGNKKYIEF